MKRGRAGRSGGNVRDYLDFSLSFGHDERFLKYSVVPDGRKLIFSGPGRVGSVVQ